MQFTIAIQPAKALRTERRALTARNPCCDRKAQFQDKKHRLKAINVTLLVTSLRHAKVFVRSFFFSSSSTRLCQSEEL